jgi:uncharacterized protein (TIGR00369 family)
MIMKREKTTTKVTGAQNITSLCFVCGKNNSIGLHAHFYNLDDGGICAEFTPREEHQSYPGRVHGGILASLLDEAIGRAMQNDHPEIWGVTVELQLKYRKPVPIDVPVKMLAHITKYSTRIFEGEGQIILEDGTVAVEAFGRYVCLPVDKISETELDDSNWFADNIEVPSQVEF